MGHVVMEWGLMIERENERNDFILLLALRLVNIYLTYHITQSEWTWTVRYYVRGLGGTGVTTNYNSWWGHRWCFYFITFKVLISLHNIICVSS